MNAKHLRLVEVAFRVIHNHESAKPMTRQPFSVAGAQSFLLMSAKYHNPQTLRKARASAFAQGQGMWREYWNQSYKPLP